MEVWPSRFYNQTKTRGQIGTLHSSLYTEIERYANQSEWLENTLIDRDNTKVDVENTLFDLEKQLDESSFLQVPEQEGTMSTPLVFLTQNEEKNPKRNREEGFSSGMDTSNVQYEAS